MAAQREKSAAAASPSSEPGAPAAVAASGERWGAAIGNLGELGANVDALQKLLARKSVFVDEDIFSKASLAADQARTIKVWYAACSPVPLPPGVLERQNPQARKQSLSWV